jgi:hypothetical protein
MGSIPDEVIELFIVLIPLAALLPSRCTQPVTIFVGLKGGRPVRKAAVSSSSFSEIV